MQVVAKRVGLCLIASFFLTQSIIAENSSSNSQVLFQNLAFDDLLLEADRIIPTNQFRSVAQNLWQKLTQEIAADQNRQTEHARRALSYQDKVMKFSFTKKGSKPQNGYPLYIALHGGGGGPAWMNDSQWEHMKVYYADSVDTGIYVATRGVTNTWNLHFVDESYSLYDRLIENMIAFENVDPNRIYLLGFSAGGDGVYQITPRMADRWAAANMSAGHHNGVRFDNLYNTPFLIQMGEYDEAYSRNKVAVENYLTLNLLQNRLRGGYTHDVFVHYNVGHNGWYDNDPTSSPQRILKNPAEWLKQGDRTTTTRNTNAVDWLNQHVRDPLPTRLVWHPQTTATRETPYSARYTTHRDLLNAPKNLFYWLAIDAQTSITENSKVIVSKDRTNNRIHFEDVQELNQIIVRLNPDMLDLKRDIEIFVNGELVGHSRRECQVATMAKTLLERGDPNFVFCDEMRMTRNSSGEWILD